jgi:hypothetical protein
MSETDKISPSSLSRCQICQQSDFFNAEKNHCARCNTVKPGKSALEVSDKGWFLIMVLAFTLCLGGIGAFFGYIDYGMKGLIKGSLIVGGIGAVMGVVFGLMMMNEPIKNKKL